MTKFLNISTDNTLGGNSPSDETVSSQKAIKSYVDNHGSWTPPSQTGNAGKFLTTDGTNTSWGNIVHIVEQQDPTSANSYTWYKLYSNGWVEQGGIVAATTSSGGIFSQTVTLPKAMTDNNYVVLANPYRNNDFVAYEGFYLAVTTYCTTTTVHLRTYGYNTSQYIDGVKWEVKGYAAQS